MHCWRNASLRQPSRLKKARGCLDLAMTPMTDLLMCPPVVLTLSLSSRACCRRCPLAAGIIGLQLLPAKGRSLHLASGLSSGQPVDPRLHRFDQGRQRTHLVAGGSQASSLVATPTHVPQEPHPRSCAASPHRDRWLGPSCQPPPPGPRGSQKSKSLSAALPPPSPHQPPARAR